jgi:hypothetical protein
MNWHDLYELLGHFNSTTKGKELLKLPVVISDFDKKHFLVSTGFEVLNDMSGLAVLTTPKPKDTPLGG